ncbi:GNAT family N-acetyltransferase [Paracraurococcus lichenis]|uniref:GNAT family N-acetyltransferase n=1 Tax=Paracraurococcus lichenis TaxID=3064888 RepID=A0ABT9E1V6_9PROT|nr:GNAT family N-acetyltransferase [Paracraurococcus sp. LOR1-02]MDO9710119.1 GNAT family N-acetyltransferase [Paracraurococcus sp. LOR1-02]
MDDPARATRLVRPAPEYLPDYVAALERGWSPDNVTPGATAREHLAFIARDAAGFLASLDDPEARGGPITLPDGSVKPRLPGFRRWIRDGGFCGAIGMRWQPGTPELPPHVLGHIGYAVVPWRRREGQATRALGLLLAEIAPLGLPWVELTTEPENLASIRVIEANGGRLVERFAKGPEYGGGPGLRFRIALPRP